MSVNNAFKKSQWCQARAHWRIKWASFVYSDKSRFCLGASDSKVLVRKRLGEHLQPKHLRPRYNGPTPGVRVWEKLPVSAGELSGLYPKDTDCKFVRQSGNSTYSTVIHEPHSRKSFLTGYPSSSHRCFNATCSTEF
ncbi:HTH_Tnp_Tc3_2 domain-containing protein [Trichonephila clavipes]|uniref:HTH_Tnp_Tc3_2 domain-containing protein n=1 Tax=Trichonephila clavipes TaxID=2585209 RepID=A0A8X6T2A8_TRICX|nr:HTH_Tnp_Tc3_2 domain-containing protein [Trichonephila clavipes]